MKKVIYIASFSFLGLVLATLIHGGVELLALDIIFNNPERFADTIWWQEWSLVHGIFSAVLWIAGLVGGLYGGVYFWDKVYVQAVCRK